VCTAATWPGRKIGETIGKVIGKYKDGQHFHRQITDTTFTYQRDHAGIDAKPASTASTATHLVPAEQPRRSRGVAGYKNLANVERDFRIIKVDDLDLRPSTTASTTASKPTC